MRIHCVTLKNYRRHQRLDVTLDANRLLIHGPNEIGKSSLIEAIHRCLFYRHRSRAAGLLERMQPRTGGDPEVTLEFSIGERQYTLSKKFRGATGSWAVLSDDAGGRLEGDAAEEELQRLLHVEEARGQQAEVFNSQWAHLWVWQGSARDEPSGTTCSSTCQQLRQQLQQQAGLGVIASQHDETVKAELIRQAEEIFTATGKVRQNSFLSQSETRLTAAQEKLQAAQRQWQAGREAADSLTRAEKTITEQAGRKTEAEAALGPLRLRLAEANRLRETQSEQQRLVEQAAARLADLTAIDDQISQLVADSRALACQIKPAEEQLSQTKQQLGQRVRETRSAVEALEQSRLSLTQIQERRDLYAAQRIAIQAAREADDLATVIRRIEAAKQQRDALRRQLDEIPAIDVAVLEELRQLEQRTTQARLAVQLLATSIELAAGGHEVQIDEVLLPVGESRTITDQTTLTIDGTTRLVISPGGGTSLAAARQESDEASELFRSRLNELGVADIAAASERLATRQQLSQQIDQQRDEIATRLGEESEETLLTREQASRQKLAAARQKVATLKQREGGGLAAIELPEESADLDELLQPIEADYEQLQQTVAEQAAAQQAAMQRQEAAEQSVLLQQQAVEADRKKLDSLRLEQSLREQQHGDEAARAAKLAAAREARETAGGALAATSDALQRYDLATLESDIDRYERSIDQANESIQAAREDRAAVKARLQHSGALDLHQARATAQAEHDLATREHRQAVKQATAIARLRDSFVQLSNERSDRLAAPLRAKAEAYLAAMFGKGTRVSLALADDRAGFSDLRVTRPGAASNSFAFGELSGGTQEQVAAALRLAMAEIIAGGSGGCLPIVFDDAFTNSDPERIGMLQRMLDLAATRGLQVIVLSCNPADYHMFGATEIDLQRHAERQQPVPSGEAAAIPPTAATAAVGAGLNAAAETAAAPAAEIDPDAAADDAQFLEALGRAGGVVGNKTLRERLGWDERHYETVKSRLVACGRIEKGRGKGGSVKLPAGG